MNNNVCENKEDGIWRNLAFLREPSPLGESNDFPRKGMHF